MTDLIEQYIRAGWAIVPITKGKNPGFAGWESRGSAITLESRQRMHPTWGVGLMHGFSSTMAFDIDDWDETKKYGIDVDALYAAPDAVTILSGRKGRGKLLYRMPTWLTLPTKKYTIRVPVEGRPGHTKSRMVFELRCGSLEGGTVQDVLPPSIHPDTGKPYEWGGKGHWSRLPMIPSQLLKVWRELSVEHAPVLVDGVASSWDEIKEALTFIDADCAYDDWRNVGMALRWQGDRTMESDQAFHLWDTWSQGAPKRYPTGKNEMTKLWNSFRSTRNSLITLGTIYHLAKENGWVRPAIDASVLFQGTAPVQPSDIMAVFKPQPPEIDLSLWPKVLATRAEEVGDGVGCDPAVPLWAGLAAVCGAIDARTRLELNPTFQVPPVLWLMTIGDPAAKKSPGSRPMLKPLSHIEASEYPKHKQALVDWEAKEIIHAKAHKVWKSYLEGEGGLMDPTMAPLMPELPDPPVPVKLTVVDITSQALALSAADRPRGLLCVLDEMNGWVEKMTSRNSGENRSTWVMAYESERYELERVGSGRKTVENLAVSIYGNIQPRVLETHFDALATDGMLQRFLPVVLRTDKDRRGKPLPDFLTSVNRWETVLRATYAVPPMHYRLSSGATKVYEAFQDWYQDQKKNERLLRASDTFLTAYGKLEGLTGRLILLFHAIESPYEPLVSTDVVERVVRIVRRFIIPTYRYLLDDEGSMSSFDSWMVDYVIQHANEPKLSMSKIRAGARRQWEHARITQPMVQYQWVMNAMATLEKAAPGQQPWVARADDGLKEHTGQVEWFVNPSLVTMFKEYRTAIIKAKDARMKEMGANGEASTSTLRRAHGLDDLEED